MSKVNNRIEIITIKIKHKKKYRLISSIYRPPNQTTYAINDFILEINEKIRDDERKRAPNR